MAVFWTGTLPVLVALGAGVQTLAGMQRVAAVVAGLFIAAWGIYSLLIALGFAVPRLPVPAAVSKPVARGIRAVAGQPAALRGMVVGLFAVVTRGSMAEAAQKALTHPAASVSAESVPEGTPPCCAKDGDGSAR
jgi:hypothetical protein